MKATDQAKLTLTETRAYLHNSKAEIVNLLKDPKVADWQHVNVERLGPILKLIGISAAEIQKALINYPKAAKEISRQISIWDNEVGNKLADLLGKVDPDQLMADALSLEKQCQELEKLKDDLLNHVSAPIAAEQKLRQSLNLNSIVPLAMASVGAKQKKMFSVGLEIFQLVSNDLNQEEPHKTLQELHQQAMKLETRFKHIDIPRMPRLAEEIVFHYIEVGASTVQEIITFMGNLNTRLSGDIDAIGKTKRALANLQKESLQTILAQLPNIAKSFGVIVISFYHKSQLKKNLSTVEETLEHLNIYHLAIKNKIVVSISAEVEIHESKINPATTASRMTKAFFVGAKGLIRSVKMMVTSLKGSEAVNEIELQLILEKATNTCKIFYGTEPKDIKALQTFIEGLIDHFNRPFPYDDIFQLTKETIATYGGEVDKFIQNHEISNDLKSLSTVPIPSPLSQLVAKIRAARSRFNKANVQKQ